MYTFVGRKCGTVRFIPSIGTVNGETVNRTSTVTDNPIENGSSISDHVLHNPARSMCKVQWWTGRLP